MTHTARHLNSAHAARRSLMIELVEESNVIVHHPVQREVRYGSLAGGVSQTRTSFPVIPEQPQFLSQPLSISARENDAGIANDFGNGAGVRRDDAGAARHSFRDGENESFPP